MPGCYVHALWRFPVNSVGYLFECCQVAFNGFLDNSSRSNGQLLAALWVAFLHSVDSKHERIANQFVFALP